MGWASLPGAFAREIDFMGTDHFFHPFALERKARDVGS
jgi:hypothetical protein